MILYILKFSRMLVLKIFEIIFYLLEKIKNLNWIHSGYSQPATAIDLRKCHRSRLITFGSILKHLA